MGSEKLNVPQRRFKEFENTGAWEQRKLGEVAKTTIGEFVIKTKQDDSYPYPVFNGGSSNTGFYNEFNNEGNKILVSARGANAGFINIIKSRYWAGNSCYSIDLLDKNQYDTDFIFQEMKRNQSRFTENQQAANIPSVSKADVEKFVVDVPKYEEQVKIAEYLANLDNLITLHQRKLDKIQAMKKSYLSEMFPAEGETKPKRRFSGFNDDWEQRKLRDMLIQPITDGPHETPDIVDNGIPFISVDAIVDNKIDFIRKRGFITEDYNNMCCKKYKPEYHDVYLVKSGSTIGKVAIVETHEIFNIWSPLAAMRCEGISDPYYLYYLLQTALLQNQVFDKASHGTQPNLSMRQLEKFDVCITQDVEEQKRIGQHFQNLDNIITLHQRKLEKLKNMKQAYLTEMFV